MNDNEYIQILSNKLKQLQNVEVNANTQDKPLIKASIDTLNGALSNISFAKSQSLFSLVELEYMDMASIYFLWPTLKELANSVSELKNDLPLIQPQKINITNSHLLDLAHDFFKNATDPKSYSIFQRFYHQPQDCINFTNSVNRTFYAETIYLPYSKEAFIKMVRFYKFEDIPVLIHEFGHCIQFLLNYDDALFDNLILFKEIVSFFYEMIGAEYFVKDKWLNAGVNFQLDFLDYNLCKLGYIKEEIEFLEHIKKKNNSLSEGIIDFLNNQNKDQIRSLIDLKIYDDIPYELGFLISCNLFMIYLNDPKYAFNLLYQIISIDLRLSAEEYFTKLYRLGVINISSVKDYNDYIKRKLVK